MEDSRLKRMLERETDLKSKKYYGYYGIYATDSGSAHHFVGGMIASNKEEVESAVRKKHPSLFYFEIGDIKDNLEKELLLRI